MQKKGKVEIRVDSGDMAWLWIGDEQICRLNEFGVFHSTDGRFNFYLQLTIPVEDVQIIRGGLK